MSAEIAVKVDNIWKRYRSGAFSASTMFSDVGNFCSKLLGNSSRQDDVLNRSDLTKESENCNDWFWAVKGVSFEVKKGETVCILGKNGAGKSTLLQVLCRVTEADAGSVEYTGRVASLLQAGVGFHEELTGRENIFLNGAILGLKRQEIIDRLPVIAEFSEIPEFLDTPVKRYSSGMRSRLGFSVAAHLGAEVMVLDEVFATGDRVFRNKCIERMKYLASGGTTIVLVTHIIEMLGDAVDRAIYMEDGEIRFDGDKEGALELYLGQNK